MLTSNLQKVSKWKIKAKGWWGVWVLSNLRGVPSLKRPLILPRPEGEMLHECWNVGLYILNHRTDHFSGVQFVLVEETFSSATPEVLVTKVQMCKKEELYKKFLFLLNTIRVKFVRPDRIPLI